MAEIDSNETPRDAEEIARRSIVLHCVIANAYGVSAEDVLEWLEEEDLQDALTPRERQFLDDEESSETDVNWMTWMAEAQVSLLWSIGKLQKLPPATEKCDTGLLVGVMPGLFEPTDAFIESARRRNPAELQQAEEEIYDLRARQKSSGSTEMIPDVAFFRHYGLSWVLGDCNQAWDEVTPDI